MALPSRWLFRKGEGMARLRRKPEEPEDFQMAPMIDMVFLLLVFFMCVSTLASAERAVQLELPESHEAKVPEDLSGRGLISVEADGTIHLGPEVVTSGELVDLLRQRLGREPGLRMQVRADRATPYRHIEEVLRACAEAGAADVIYATFEAR